jgi:hypothetical protein
VSDVAGNRNSVRVSGINVDLTPPSLNINGARDGSTFTICSPPRRPRFAPTDSLSGLASGTQGDNWTSSLMASGVGTYTYNTHAQDEAGNRSSETRTYTVQYGDAALGGAFRGFLPPINAKRSGSFKLGRTIPIKFQLLCHGVSIANAVARLTLKPADGTTTPGTDQPISTDEADEAMTGNLFRYDSTSHQYIFNLSTKRGYTTPNGTTKSFAPGMWTLSVLLDDGTYRSVNIRLTGSNHESRNTRSEAACGDQRREGASLHCDGVRSLADFKGFFDFVLLTNALEG